MRRVVTQRSNLSKRSTTILPRVTIPSWTTRHRNRPTGSQKVFVYPDRELSSAYATKILSGLLQKKIAPWSGGDGGLTRGAAAQMVYQQLTRGRGKGTN